MSSVAATEACTCFAPDSPAACELYGKTDVAFVGRAIFVPPNRAAGRVRFRLTQALKGVAGSEVSVLNEESGVGCGYQFRQGEDYVIFATRNGDGDITIAPCSSTIWMVHAPDYAYPEFRREAAKAVAFAASLSKPAAGGRIFGEIGVRVPFKAPGDAAKRPVDGATVILRGVDEERRTTSVSGQYEFTGLPRGTYTVSVTMPAGLPPARSARPPAHVLSQDAFRFDYEREDTRSITIADARGCGYAPFEAEFDGEVAGMVVRHDGTPFEGLSVHLFPATIDPQRQEFYTARVETDAHGAYRISHVPPGRYAVGINIRDEPTDALPFPAIYYRDPGADGRSIVELAAGTHAELGVLRVPPPMAKHEITGTVAWNDGRSPAGSAVLICEDRAGRLREYCRSSPLKADGGFSLALFAGRTYNITAKAPDPRGWWDKATGEEVPPIATAELVVTLDRDINDLRLILMPRRSRR